MPSVGLEPTIPAIEQLHTYYALYCTATRIGGHNLYSIKGSISSRSIRSSSSSGGSGSGSGGGGGSSSSNSNHIVIAFCLLGFCTVYIGS